MLGTSGIVTAIIRRELSQRQFARRRTSARVYRRERAVAATLLTIALAGCMTMQPIAGTVPELRQRIAAGRALKVGDHVRVVTSDGRPHEFVVTRVTTDAIEGGGESIAIEQILNVETRQFAAGKVAIVVGGILLGVVTVGAVVALHSVKPSYSGN